MYIYSELQNLLSASEHLPNVYSVFTLASRSETILRHLFERNIFWKHLNSFPRRRMRELHYSPGTRVGRPAEKFKSFRHIPFDFCCFITDRVKRDNFLFNLTFFLLHYLTRRYFAGFWQKHPEVLKYRTETRV